VALPGTAQRVSGRIGFQQRLREIRDRAGAWADAEQRRSENPRAIVTFPDPPSDVVWAKSISVNELRPWEWAAMDAHDHYRILEIRHAWDEGRREQREAQAEMAKQKQQAAGR
jgi:hypothetical protein